ncbi:MAG: CHRD domain-containing protein [Pseudomonadota bacterium]|nr:CHRD domain-containing protein [Pseudomonadota bacterium]
MKSHILSSLVIAAAVVAAAPATGQEGGRRLSAILSGAAEAPGPGDPDGAGTAEIRVNAGQRQVCYSLSVTRIDPATAAHIHEAAPGSAGPVVVTLTAPARGRSQGCVRISRALAQELIQTPQHYYVNVHNAAFPAGAVRGQLAR